MSIHPHANFSSTYKKYVESTRSARRSELHPNALSKYQSGRSSRANTSRPSSLSSCSERPYDDPRHFRLNQRAAKVPKVTLLKWEDEGTVCLQVEVGGNVVARRADTNFINGTSLLSIVGIPYVQRDQILRFENVKKVVRVGPRHLKGTWIPFQRARGLAKRERITKKLYPLLNEDISSLIMQELAAISSHSVLELEQNMLVTKQENRRRSDSVSSNQTTSSNNSFQLVGPEDTLSENDAPEYSSYAHLGQQEETEALRGLLVQMTNGRRLAEFECCVLLGRIDVIRNQFDQQLATNAVSFNKIRN